MPNKIVSVVVKEAPLLGFKQKLDLEVSATSLSFYKDDKGNLVCQSSYVVINEPDSATVVSSSSFQSLKEGVTTVPVPPQIEGALSAWFKQAVPVLLKTLQPDVPVA